MPLSTLTAKLAGYLNQMNSSCKQAAIGSVIKDAQERIVAIEATGVGNALASAKIIVGSAGGLSAAVSMSGDATISNLGAVTIANAAVSKAKLAAALQPSHVAKFAGSSAAEVDADASIVVAIPGALDTDVASVVLRAAANDIYVKKAVLTADTLTITLSGNGGAGTVADYVIFRAA